VSPRVKAFLALLLASMDVCVYAAAPSPTFTPTIGPGFVYDCFVTNNNIVAVTISANVAYVGGSFDKVGKSTGPMAIVGASDGVMVPGFPKVTGSSVYASISDGSGGWYIGGDFNYVNGEVRKNIAHIYSNGSLDPDFKAGLAFSDGINPDTGIIYSLALNSGVLYAGGFFNYVTSTAGAAFARNNLAAFDASGAVLPWNPDVNMQVNALAVHPAAGTYCVFAGGLFTSVNSGTARGRLASFDTSNGTANPAWNPDLNGTVHSLLVSGTLLYAGGEFTQANTGTAPVARNRIAAFPFSISSPTSFDPNCNGTVLGLTATGTSLYAGGLFTSVNSSTARNYLAAFTLGGAGTAQAWNPDPNNEVYGIALHNNNIYAGGNFTNVNTGMNNKNYAAAFDAVTGVVLYAWDPNPMGIVTRLCPSGGNMMIGGTFRSVNCINRRNAAAFDLNTQTLLQWDPGPNGFVQALALANNMVYMGGFFTFVNYGSIPRNRLAAVDMTYGTAQQWNPNISGACYVIEPSGNTIYAGGAFGTAGGVARNYAASFDQVYGTLQYWDPDFDYNVLTLKVSGNALYAGGRFNSAGAGSYSRNYGASFDISVFGASSVPNAWNPNFDGEVTVLNAHNGKIYAGGNFTHTNSVLRNYAACFQAGSSVPDAWDPSPDNWVSSITFFTNAAYLGGGFTGINTMTSPFGVHYAAAVDDTTGEVFKSWAPVFDNSVSYLAQALSRVYCGGNFSSVSNLPSSYIGQVECPPNLYTPTYTFTVSPTITATFTITTTGTITKTGTVMPTSTITVTPTIPPAPEGGSYVFPVPAENTVTFVLDLSEQASGQVAIYDIAGNMVKTADFSGNAGPDNRVAVDVSRLSQGPYYYFIKAEGMSGAKIKFKYKKFIIKRPGGK
jgi:hypothetical protein